MITTDWSDRFWKKVDASSSGCWTWQADTNPKGYGRFMLDHQVRSASRLAFFLANGRMPVQQIMHTCDNPPCCNPAHLHEGSNADNSRDMAIKERARATKLTATAISKIRLLYQAGTSQGNIAKEFGVTQSNVSAICAYKTWRHVP